MTLGVLWFILIAVLFGGYYVLDGFDLGAAILSPFVAKTESEKRAIVHAIGPVWDGNEVWLLTGGGALFAAFAPAYATAFSGFYLAIMLVLFGLIVRAVALEFRMYDAKWRKLWDALFFVGSLLPALLFGVALGNCLQGVALDANGDYIGGFFALLRPFPLLCGLLGLATIVTQGACWLSLKVEVGVELQQRAARARKTLQLVTCALFVIVTAVFFLFIQTPIERGVPEGFALLGVLFVVCGMVIGFAKGLRGGDLGALVANSLVCLGLLVLFAATAFPDLIVSSGPGASISIGNAASSDYSLTVMTIVACIGIPLVLIYHVLVYRTFRGRVAVEE